MFGDAVFAGQRVSREEIADLVGAAPNIARATRMLHRAYRRARELCEKIDDPDLRDDLAGAAPSVTGLDPVVGSRPSPFGPANPDVIEVSIDGNPLPRAPEWTYNLILQYSIPVNDAEFYIHTDWNYRDDSNLFLHETVEFVADSRVLGGLRIGYRTENLDAALVGRNITDEISVDGGINFNNLTAFINEPAFWGVEVRYDF